jgi:hypothetical protein
MMAYCILLSKNPFISLFKVTGACPISFIIALVLSTTELSVQGAGMISTNGT